MWPLSGPQTGSGSAKAGDGSAGTSHPVAADATADQCPVDEETRKVWLAQRRGPPADDGAKKSESSRAAYAFLSGKDAPQGSTQTAAAPAGLSTERVVSSIPRFSMWQKQDETKPKPKAGDRKTEQDDAHRAADAPADPSTSKNWVYPSPSQFYAAMARKNHNPRAEDMNTVVPIHNAVNERAWQQILGWEHLAGDGGASVAQCGGPKLVSFKGRPRDVTWRAWWRSLTGYQRPFDRHDWEVDRCGTRVRYIIDFYTGRARQGSDVPAGLSFFLDVRPSPAQYEGVRMRLIKFLGLGFSQREDKEPAISS